MLSVINLFAIVSIAPVEIGDNPGFSGIVKGELNTKRGNTDIGNYMAGLKLLYDNNQSYLMWGEFNFTYAEASGVKNTNQTFSHIRYIHKLQHRLDWEVFIQSQTNEFTNVAERFLNGGGLRVHLKKKRYGNLYFGLGAFYEYINYTTTVDKSENNIRGNFYIAYTKTFQKTTKLSYIAYYQPKIGDIDDYMILNTIELIIPVYKKLSLDFTINYDNDSMPAISVKREDFSQKTAFIYKF